MADFLLLGTLGCHLCEDAEQLLHGFKLDVTYIDIAEQTEWQADYALRIPVLHHRGSGKELGWPFDSEQISQFLRELAEFSGE